jgi:5-methylthioribose kinase
MTELTADNAVDYLRQHGQDEFDSATATLLGWGVSNVVLRVETSTQSIILKQSRPQLRTRDAWFSDLDRVFREQEVMEFLQPLLPEGVVPRVLFADRDNYLFAMTDAGRDTRVWKEMLLKGEVQPIDGTRAGRILGRIHQATAERVEQLRPFTDHSVFVQLRVDPFYRRVQERCPDVAEALAVVIEQSLTLKEALCHGDFSPKNLLVVGDAFTLVDYETACFGDPAFDLGFFLSHLLLKAVKHSPNADSMWSLIDAFWVGYDAEVTWRSSIELAGRSVGHLAACLLARIDGTSPVDYLPEEPRREAVRRMARSLFRWRPSRWSDVVNLVEGELRHVDS